MKPVSHRGTLHHAATPQLLQLLRRRGAPEVDLQGLTEDEALDLLKVFPPAKQGGGRP